MINHLWLNVGCKVYNDYVPFEWNEYFKKVGDYRGMIYCDMKQIVALRLAKEGKTLQYIANFLNLSNHATAYNYLHKRKSTSDIKEVGKHYRDWIQKGVYPNTIIQPYAKKVTPLEGFNHVFKLKKI